MRNDKILKDILEFFDNVFVEKRKGQYNYAQYRSSWLKKIELKSTDRDESKSSRTTRKLQNKLTRKYGKRIRTEASVAEGMTLRFEQINNGKEEQSLIDSSKLQAFDILDLKTGTAYEISLADAFAEFFKDVLKALLDSRVKRLCLCMRNHYYKNASKSGYARVTDSEMVHQYIALARLYKLDIELVDIFPSCNKG